MPIGREFRCRMQEEAKSRNAKVNAFFIDESETMKKFKADALAIDGDGQRIPGKSPQVFLESDVSLRELAAETIVNRRTGEPVGMGFIAEFFGQDEHSRDRFYSMQRRFQEAGELSAIDYTMFAGITGPFVYNATLKGFEHEQFVFSKMAGTYNTTFITGERLPGVSLPYTDDAAGYDSADAAAQGQEDLLLKRPGKEFATATLGENYVDLPETELRGLRIGIERTTIYTDRVGMIASNAARVGEILGLHKEQRGLRTFLGITSVTYKEKFQFDSAPVTIGPWQLGDAVTNSNADQLSVTYSDRKFPFINDISANPLTDWTNFKASDKAFSRVVDPNNGLPLTLGLQGVLAPFSQRMEIPRILEAWNIWKLSASSVSGGAFGNGSINTVSANPLTQALGSLDVRTSRMMVQEMVKSGLYAYDGAGGLPDPELVWFTGDFKEAIKYMTNWPIKVQQAPMNSDAAFTHDIILQWRADERGKWAWFNPRLVQRNNRYGQT